MARAGFVAGQRRPARGKHQHQGALRDCFGRNRADSARYRTPREAPVALRYRSRPRVVAVGAHLEIALLGLWVVIADISIHGVPRPQATLVTYSIGRNVNESSPTISPAKWAGPPKSGGHHGVSVSESALFVAGTSP